MNTIRSVRQCSVVFNELFLQIVDRQTALENAVRGRLEQFGSELGSCSEDICRTFAQIVEVSG